MLRINNLKFNNKIFKGKQIDQLEEYLIEQEKKLVKAMGYKEYLMATSLRRNADIRIRR